MLPNLNGSVSVKVVLIFRETGSEYSCKWCYTSGIYNRLLIEFDKLAGVPVLLNTSFNDNGQPIVESPVDAIQTYLNTNIDILVLENYIIKK